MPKIPSPAHPLLRAGLSRRGFIAAAGSGLLVPAGLMAAPSAGDRKFLFIFANGGWDVTYAFAPMFDSPNVDTESDAETAEENGIPFVDHGNRPSVRRFFEEFGDQTCVLNGLEVRSITHERCRRLIMTGVVESADDWGALLAANGGGEHLLPCLVASGPSFTDQFTASVVRVGENGQFASLLDGSAFFESVQPITGPSNGAEGVQDEFVKARAAAFQSRVGAGDPARFADAYAGALDQAAQVYALQDALDLSVNSSGYVPVSDRITPAYSCFELGLSRCAVVQHDGLWDVGWDTHSTISEQSDHFETLFNDLNVILGALQTRVDPDGVPLSETVTVVVLSEMGRHPRLNANAGKDHWTYTSAMIIGPGVAGGRSIGGYDDDLLGRAIDLASGDLSDSGTPLTAAHLGSTLLALGDVDPEPWLPGVEPIAAALE